MEIKSFQLNNVGRFESLHVDLAPTASMATNVTVFVGSNGAGKTSLLKSLATSLSWFVARLRSEKGSGNPIPEEAITNSVLSASVDIDVYHQGNSYNWTIAKTQKGKKGNLNSNLTEASKLADFFRASLSNDESTSLPLIAFYSVERVVLDIPMKIRGKHSFLQIDGYDNSLSHGVDFRRFFEWFREREDTENESGISQEILDKLQSMVGSDSEVWSKLAQLKASSRDKQLTAVRTAIANFMPGFSNLRVRRNPLHMSIDKHEEQLNVLQLSQGEKSLMALVGDIARRLAMMNPQLENPLHGDGIVLIDEVDMHLHPTWQRNVIARLTDTFPSCQFVLTTHSPLVISDYKDALVYLLEEDKLSALPSQYGQDANTVLLDVMGTSARNANIDGKLNDLLDAIQARHFNLAHQLVTELDAELPSGNMELAKAKLILRKQELRRAED